MKITAQEEYGLRCILQLASQPTGEVVTVGEVARREGLSNAYTEKLLRILARAGLAESIRGTNGGYRLSRTSDEITLGDVARALGGAQSSGEICNRFTGNRNVCIHEGDCSIRTVWSGISDYVFEVMDNIHLSSIVRRENLIGHL